MENLKSVEGFQRPSQQLQSAGVFSQETCREGEAVQHAA